MSIVTLPRAQIPLTLNGNAISIEWYRWAHDITQRAGGVSGPSTNDLAVTEYADAGIEELRATVHSLSDTVWQMSEPSELRGQVASLAERMAALDERYEL